MSCNAAEIFDNNLEEIGGKHDSSTEETLAAGHYHGCLEHHLHLHEHLRIDQHHSLTIMSHYCASNTFSHITTLSSLLKYIVILLTSASHMRYRTDRRRIIR